MFLGRMKLSMLEMVTSGAFVVFLLIGMGGFFLVLRRLNAMQSNILQLHASHSTTQEGIQHLQKSTQEDIHQIQVAQASTQATVTATQRETQMFIQDLKIVQTTSQALMHEVKTLQSSSQALMVDWQKETTQLSRALRTNYQQGTWGERELRQVVELSGMIQHCDFDLHPRLPGGQVPDLVIHMHNNRSIAVDAKAPSQSYLDAMKCEDEKIRAVKLQEYAQSVRRTMNDLARKEYWKELESSLALIILFVPNEAMFRAALEYDLTLLDVSTQKNVLLASPITLIALLKAIAHGWSQESRAQNVQHIVDQSKELHKELETWLRQWQQLRRAVNDVTNEFNRVATSYETTILPLIKDMGSFDGTFTFKEKAFGLKAIRTNVKSLVDGEEIGEESDNVTLQTKITRSFEKFKDVFALSFSE
ncbi:hypothetical protein KDW_38760 [Dictyobacter vulcani]|uniref:DNA recombination protein RmuC n=1 Tax=Dictyobacter vulcani TaxID=2607529 RepID=A0A5J4KJN8_9CHLR|nr:DNA recombination protein RmuC [Dictyobacter vulcani]GER89714.1 hypothetical protein KDW_38760 [Dictyobacter vulcani]